MALQLSTSPTGHIWRARPNHTPQRNTARWLLAGVAGVSGIIAGGFALFGAWPVLPFAGLETLLLWVALRHLASHAEDFQEITLDRETLRIVTTSGKQATTHSFQTYWAQVRYTPAGIGMRPAQLVIHSHGREVEIGYLLNASEKQALANKLKQQILALRQAVSEKPNQP